MSCLRTVSRSTAALATAAALSAGVLAGCGSAASSSAGATSSSAAPSSSATSSSAAAQNGAAGHPQPNHYGAASVPPWPAPKNVEAGVHAAGLQLLSAEGAAQHFHAHLDVFVDGKPVRVPAGIGIDEAAQKISALHTHDPSGVLHIESPDPNEKYILGQFFDEWNVRLDASHLGGLTAGNGKSLTAYVNGKKFEGNPAAIPLTEHEEIALVYGPAGSNFTPPSTYDFGNL